MLFKKVKVVLCRIKTHGWKLLKPCSKHFFKIFNFWFVVFFFPCQWNTLPTAAAWFSAFMMSRYFSLSMSKLFLLIEVNFVTNDSTKFLISLLVSPSLHLKVPPLQTLERLLPKSNLTVDVSNLIFIFFWLDCHGHPCTSLSILPQVELLPTAAMLPCRI